MGKRTVYYRQCRLVRKAAAAELHQTSWIPEKFAMAGKVLKLRQGGGWVDGWVVASVGSIRLAQEELPDPHREARGHRRATGDDMKKETNT